MKQWIAIILGVVFAGVSVARGEDIDLGGLRTVVVLQEMTLKTLDSFARQTLTTITGKARIDGKDPVYSVLDIVFRPEGYVNRPMIKVRNVPLRMRIADLVKGQPEERERIEKTGMISLTFFVGRVQGMLEQLQAHDARLSPAIGEVYRAAGAMGMLCDPRQFDLALVPPGVGGDQSWKTPRQLLGNSPKWAKFIAEQGERPQAAVGGYEGKAEALTGIIDAYVELGRAWRAGDTGGVNRAAGVLARELPGVNQTAYPSSAKRGVEVWYNRLAKFTIPGFAFYFMAFVCFLMSARAGVGRVRRWGMRFMVLAVLVHTAGIGIRWWLAPAGRIPIMNQFESVMASAWFGAVIAAALEMWKPRGIFGAAGSFVGWLSLIALWATPIVTGVQIGAEIGQVAGILMDYWLYIHVNLVVASYALIGMSFLLGVWWLVRYWRSGSEMAAVGADVSEERSVGVSAGVLGEEDRGELREGGRVGHGGRPHPSPLPEGEGTGGAETFLGVLDQCNMVVLQLAFWILGAGIICGAIWADHSWGRPWGWDPKETFALVTWIVYLIVVHVRLVTRRKALWTAGLSVVAFFVMLFNWIGVNFFLVGLHSYA